jgi:ribose 5-phosphate isomerase A
MSADPEIPTRAAERALDFVGDGDVVGLGTGRAATAFVEALGRRMGEGALTVRCVATSRQTEDLARRLGLPLIGLGDCDAIDVTVDGADEIATDGDVIKGLGGALLREKVVASASRRWVLCVNAGKLVPTLGARGVLPVEVVPFAAPFVARRLTGLGLRPEPRRAESGDLYKTDNEHIIMDCRFEVLPAPAAALERALRAIPGVVESGLFVGMRPVVVVQRGADVEVIGA